MSNPRSSRVRIILGFTLAILQALPAYSGTIAFTRGGLNARSSNRFRGTGNVLTTVPRGTEGEVVDRWELPSGNFSVQVKITKLGAAGTSLKVDDVIWVYYHKAAGKRLVELYDDEGTKVTDLNDPARKWAIALSSFRTPKSEPKKEVVCEDCNVNRIPQKDTAPLSTPQVQEIKEVVATVEKIEEKTEEKVVPENDKTVPVVDVAVEEVMAYIAKAQKANLSKKQLRSTSESTNRLIAQTLIDECKKQGVPLELALGIIEQESHFYAKSHSGPGARGLMQIMPATYRDNTKRRDYNRLYDPVVNIQVGIEEIAGYLKKYDGDIEKSLQAYNWGAGNLDAYLAGTCKAKHRKNGVCVMARETIAYVPAVLKYRDAYVAYQQTTGTNLA